MGTIQRLERLERRTLGGVRFMVWGGLRSIYRVVRHQS